MVLTKSTFVALASIYLAGCSALVSGESPLAGSLQGTQTVSDIYRGAQGDSVGAPDAQKKLGSKRPISEGDNLTKRYWSAVQPMDQRFSRVPNPDLVMVVFPHMAKGGYPIPGYVTVFPMYESVQYGLPGEVADDVIERNAYKYMKAKTASATASHGSN